MGQTTRHFSALMRKNFINWAREPCSAVCQVLFPALLMLILVYVRERITPVVYSAESLVILETPQYTMDLSASDQSVIDTDATNTRNKDMFSYYGYSELILNKTINETSPLTFNPENCLIENSWVLPKVAASYIAIVGDLSTNEVMARVNENLVPLATYWKDNNVNNLTLVYYDTMADLTDYIASETYLFPDEGICFGISVEINPATGQYDANLIFDDQTQFGGVIGVGVPQTNEPAYSVYTSKPNTKDYNMLSNDGYAFAQNLVANSILQVKTGVNSASITVMNVPLPSDKIVTDAFAQILSGLFPFFLVLIYLGPVYNTVYGLVQEKEQRSKESMRMMGMSDLPYWLSWFTFYSIQSTLISVLAWAFLCINVIKDGSGGYIFLYIWLFGESIMGQIVFYQSLFSRAKYSGLLAICFFFMLQFVNLPLANTTSVGAKAICSLIPQVAASQMAVIWADFEENQLGLDSTTVNEQIMGFSFIEGIWLFIPGLVLWALLGFYCDAVLPKQYGSKSHPCFCFFPSTYKGLSKCCTSSDVADEGQDDVAQSRNSNLLGEDDKSDEMEVRYLDKRNYEPVASEVARQGLDGSYLRIEDLEKIYDNNFHAVKGLNVKIYQNQIFALLGQNGAGKSTTISMLTGLIQATKGTARCYGFDMFKEEDKVRQIMGICPQHDVLFDKLTPKEHLDIFYDFKGGNPELKAKEIADLIRDVGLTTDQDKPAGTLSGGNKRKLSVAISLCGGSKLVLLDEPTAGMDLGARRDLWNMLKNYRRDKIIILTTHYMDEADVLGDRIGIMAQGKMMCLGTSLFLKKRFGAGYKITMVKESKQANTMIEPYLKQNLGEVELLSEISSEITFQVSNEAAKSFKKFFSIFDEELSSLGIVSYGVSITTLEEVFLKINQEFKINIGNAAVEDKVKEQTGQDVDEMRASLLEPQEDGVAKSRQSLNDSQREPEQIDTKVQHESNRLSDEEMNNGDGPERLVGNPTTSSTIKALLIKRFHLYKRDKTAIICEVVVPVFLVLIGCLLNNIDFSQKSYTIAVSPDLYPSPQRIQMNDANVQTSTSMYTPQEFYNNLPGVSSDSGYWDANFTANPDNTSIIFPQADTNPLNFLEYYFGVQDLSKFGNPSPVRYGSYSMYQADKENHVYQFATMLNLTSSMVTAYYPQYMYESILKTTVDVDLNLNTVPFPTMYQLQLRSSSQNAFGYAGYVGFAFCFMPCAIVSFIVLERVENLRHMQIISGMSLPAYWISNMIADMIKLYIPIGCIMLLSVAFDSNYPGTWVLYMLLPPALVPWTYCSSFLFSKDGNAQIITLFLNYFVCCLMGIMVFVLQFIPQTFKLGAILRWSLCIFPSYCVVNGILWSSSGTISIQVRQTNPSYPQLSEDIWAMSNLGGDAVILACHFVFDTLLLVLIELGAFSWFTKLPIFQPAFIAANADLKLDPDVVAEEQRVRLNKSDVIRVSDFRKAYQTATGNPFRSNSFLAVERISFGLDYGECFALLGVNGAGKSTTFKSLTADTTPTSGEITVAGHNIETDFEQARKLIGYCPQKDAIFPLMTVEEHIWYYARIKGIPEHLLENIVERSIVDLNLSDHRVKPAGTLSGGNKRKLSVAMATLGNPPIILLDEPSAGMDPEARRFMWTVVERISQRDKKSAVILTTHSMEEAEALSTKMGIMVRGGVFKCYGSSQHIKNKFGTGYECEIKIRKPTYTEIATISETIGFTQMIDQRIDLNEAIATANKFGKYDETIIEQIKEKGLGSDLIFEAQKGTGNQANTVRLINFVTYLYTMENGLRCALILSKSFSQVELIEQCSDFFKFRIPRDNKTIGFLFGGIEDKKQELNISEYSVSQTSLEQIFQQFATQSILEDKATLVFQTDGMGQLRVQEERRSTLKKADQRPSEFE